MKNSTVSCLVNGDHDCIAHLLQERRANLQQKLLSETPFMALGKPLLLD